MQTLVITPVILIVIIIAYEGIDLGLEFSEQIVVLRQNAVPEGPVPARDVTPDYEVIGRAAEVSNTMIIEPSGKVGVDLA
jgi:hypothetical protein